MQTIKTILWVEDFDNKDTAVPAEDLDAPEVTEVADHVGEINKVFPELHRNRVLLQESIENALVSIDEHFDDYDCVVLDINLNKTYPLDEDARNKIKDKFDKSGVHLRTKEDYPPDSVEAKNYTTVDEELKQNAGFYLYLYLLCKGFLKDRVIMRTAFGGSGEGSLTNIWSKVFKRSGLQPPDSVEKIDGNDKIDGNNKFHDKLDTLYKDGNPNYYLIRRIVLDATNYWNNQLKAEDSINDDAEDSINDDFVFNAAADKAKKLNNFGLRKMMDTARAMFALRLDKNIGEIFSETLRNLSFPFEAYADYNEVKKNKNAVTYLSIMRLMRNWYAHNLFVENAPTEKEFVFLFIVALRALFDKKCESVPPLDYEKAALEIFFSEDGMKPDIRIIEGHVYKAYRKTYDLMNSPKTLSCDYSKMLDALGRDKKQKRAYSNLYSKLIDLIWTSRFEVTLNFHSDKKDLIKQTPYYRDSAPVYFNFNKPDIDDSDILSKLLHVDYALRQRDPAQP
jgi:hypothetical protein